MRHSKKKEKNQKEASRRPPIARLKNTKRFAHQQKSRNQTLGRKTLENQKETLLQKSSKNTSWHPSHLSKATPRRGFLLLPGLQDPARWRPRSRPQQCKRAKGGVSWGRRSLLKSLWSRELSLMFGFLRWLWCSGNVFCLRCLFRGSDGPVWLIRDGF